VTPSLARRLVAEALGTACLLAVVVGSGIMGERLANGNMAIALLANAGATGCALAVLIAVLGPVSGAHFNPLVTIALSRDNGMERSTVALYSLVQFAAALAGVAVAHAMFGEPALFASTKVRAGFAQALGEFVATFGLLLAVFGCVRQRIAAAPAIVAAYITAAYWFTSSTSFANPAVTVARSLSDTFAGIRPADVPVFVVAQVAGAAAAMVLARWLWPRATPGH
jgi:glycerol uptake facilitator-like aquaporin